MTAEAIIALLNELITLEPAAQKMVLALIAGLKGKSDAEILAGDATDWASIIIVAHQAQQPPAK